MGNRTKKKADAASKKTEQKRKKAAIDDKTFGLKNKNKSKVVQKYVQGVEKSVLTGGDPKLRKQEEQRKALKAQAKARKKAQKDEQDALFGAALLAVQKKGTSNKKAGKVESVGRDGNDDGKKVGTSRAMKMMYQMDAQEMEDKLREDPNYVPTLEDEIEAQRQELVKKLKASGKKGTPVTEATFRAWQERKRKRRADEAKKKVEAELKKKKGGKGLSVLSGRDLYNYKKELFDRDDEEDQQQQGDNGSSTPREEKKDASATVDQVMADKVEENLFLEGDDEDLDDLDDLDED